MTSVEFLDLVKKPSGRGTLREEITSTIEVVNNLKGGLEAIRDDNAEQILVEISSLKDRLTARVGEMFKRDPASVFESLGRNHKNSAEAIQDENGFSGYSVESVPEIVIEETITPAKDLETVRHGLSSVAKDIDREAEVNEEQEFVTLQRAMSLTGLSWQQLYKNADIYEVERKIEENETFFRTSDLVAMSMIIGRPLPVVNDVEQTPSVSEKQPLTKLEETSQEKVNEKPGPMGRTVLINTEDVQRIKTEMKSKKKNVSRGNSTQTTSNPKQEANLKPIDLSRVNRIVLPDAEEWISMQEVRSDLGLTEKQLVNFLEMAKGSSNVNKVGGRNYLKRNDIERLKGLWDSMQAAPRGRASKKQEVAVRDEEYGFAIISQSAGDLIDQHLSELGKLKFDKEKNKAWALEQNQAALSSKYLSLLADFDVLNEQQKQKVKTILTDKKVLNIVRGFNTRYSRKKEIRNDTTRDLYLKNADNVANYFAGIALNILRLRDENDTVIREDATQQLIDDNISIIEKGKEAYDNLISHNLRLAVSVAKKYTWTGTSFEDLISYGEEGLIEAAVRFEPNYGYDFSTFATWWVRQSIGRKVMDEQNTIRLPIHVVEKLSTVNKVFERILESTGREPTDRELISELGTEYRDAINARKLRSVRSLNATTGDEDEGEFGDVVAVEEVDYQKIVENNELHDVLMAALEQIPVRERKVLMMRFGIGGSTPMTLDKIAGELGRPKERVRQLEQTGLSKLQKLLSGYHSGQKSQFLKGVRGVNERSENENQDSGQKINAAQSKEEGDAYEMRGVIHSSWFYETKIEGVNDSELKGALMEAVKSEEEVEDWISPGEIPLILGITRQRWHQIKNDYQYRSKLVGKGEYVLLEDLLRIKEERDQVRLDLNMEKTINNGNRTDNSTQRWCRPSEIPYILGITPEEWSLSKGQYEFKTKGEGENALIAYDDIIRIWEERRYGRKH